MKGYRLPNKQRKAVNVSKMQGGCMQTGSTSVAKVKIDSSMQWRMMNAKAIIDDVCNILAIWF